MYTVKNNDTGSLHVGVVGGEYAVGDAILIKGEAKPRVITYIMGRGEKTHLCCKGTGKFPEGEVEFSRV